MPQAFHRRCLVIVGKFVALYCFTWRNLLRLISNMIFIAAAHCSMKNHRFFTYDRRQKCNAGLDEVLWQLYMDVFFAGKTRPKLWRREQIMITSRVCYCIRRGDRYEDEDSGYGAESFASWLTRRRPYLGDIIRPMTPMTKLSYCSIPYFLNSVRFCRLCFGQTSAVMTIDCRRYLTASGTGMGRVLRSPPRYTDDCR